MARLVTDGAEMGDILFFDYSAAAVSASTASKRSGAYGYHIQVGGASVTISSGGVSEIYVRFGFRINYQNNLSGGSKFLMFRNGTTVLLTLYWSGYTTNRLSLYSGDASTLLATGTIPFLPSTWYLVEAYIKIADSGGRFVTKIDGIQDSDYTGDTKPGSATTITNILLNTSSSGMQFYIDDIAVNDTSGGSDNSWIGDGHIIFLGPNANGDSSTWVGSDGNSTDNYALVDDIPPSSTDYVEASSSGDTDLYNLAACGLSSVNILRVWPEARAADTVAAGGQIYLPIKTNSTQYDGTAVSLLTTYTKRLIGDVRTVNPNTSAAWTTAQLDALQVGAKVV